MLNSKKKNMHDISMTKTTLIHVVNYIGLRLRANVREHIHQYTSPYLYFLRKLSNVLHVVFN